MSGAVSRAHVSRDQAKVQPCCFCRCPCTGTAHTQEDSLASCSAFQCCLVLIQGVDSEEGMPKLQSSWVAKRSSDAICTEMHHAKKRVIVEEMGVLAAREGLDGELSRSQVGRADPGVKLSPWEGLDARVRAERVPHVQTAVRWTLGGVVSCACWQVVAFS